MIEWFDPVKKEPDDEQTVLLLVPDASEPVWPGFVSDGVWYWASGSRVDCTVVGWCEMPIGPKNIAVDEFGKAWEVSR